MEFWFKKWPKLVPCCVLLEAWNNNSGVIHGHTHLLLEIPHCQTDNTVGKMYVHWGLILGNEISQRVQFEVLRRKRHHHVHLGFRRLSKLTQFCFHSFLACDNSGKRNALLEYGAFEPIRSSEFPLPSLLSQESLSFARWSASAFIFFVAVGCFPVMRNTCKVQMIRLWLECFSHSWCWCLCFPDICISVVIYPILIVVIIWLSSLFTSEVYFVCLSIA